MVDNPYTVLGLSEGASADEIKSAYRKKAKECHPDLHPDDPHAQEKMNDVNEAYDLLTNPDKYSSWKASRSASSQSYQSSSYSNPYSQSYQNSAYNDPFNQFFRNAGYSDPFNTSSQSGQNNGQYSNQYHRYTNQNPYGFNGFTYRRRTSSSPLRLIGRIIAFIFVMRLIRVLFWLLMSGGMYYMR